MKSVNLQTGVALIQVLLIVAMILILVVQLSSQSKEQLEVAIKLKEKSQWLMKMDTELEEIKFDLLTTPRNQSSNTQPRNWNFYGKSFVRQGIIVTLQDESGLLSLAYQGDTIEQLGLLPVNSPTERKLAIKNIKMWQGTDESGSILPNSPGVLLQSMSETRLVPGWQDIIVDEELFTHLPTEQFNQFNAPDKLIQRLVKPGEVEKVMSLRENGVYSISQLNRLFTVPLESYSFYPPGIVRLKAQKTFEEWTLNRQYKVKLEPTSNKPIKQFGY